MVAIRIFKPGSGADEVRTSLVFAAFMLAVPLGAKLIARLSGAEVGDLPQRAVMALAGIYFMRQGNAFPKMLAPVPRLGRDSASAQIFRRFAGWVWVLTGLALVAAWVQLPPALAGDLTLCVVPAGMLLIAIRWGTLPPPDGRGNGRLESAGR